MSRLTHSRRPARSYGFTLIELMLVTAILGLVVTAIGACLGGGIRAWDASRTFNTVEAQALFGLRILHRDIMNAVPFYAVPFSGDRQEVSFLIRRDPLSEEESGLATVRYEFDSHNGTLLRTAWPFPGDAPYGDTATEQLIGNLSWLSFAYGAGEAPGQRIETWGDATNHPCVIDVVMDLKVGDQTLTLSESFVPALDSGRKGDG